jgi:hypothetical protein
MGNWYEGVHDAQATYPAQPDHRRPLATSAIPKNEKALRRDRQRAFKIFWSGWLPSLQTVGASRPTAEPCFA